MAVGEGSTEPVKDASPQQQHPNPIDKSPSKSTATQSDEEDQDDAEEEEEEEEDDGEEEEPRLKYATLTRSLSNLYRNGDASSTFLVAGDKMIVGTHNGNIHVLTLPTFETLKIYRAHSASVSAISTSPFPPPLPGLKLDATLRIATETVQEKDKSPSSSPAGKGSPRPGPVPFTASNQIYIASSSIDGNVCVSSLVDQKDIQLRNFGRPVQSVALSPQYKSDRNYISGGQAGSLILTTGGQLGRSANATTTGAAAAASGWLGSIGLGANAGTDKVLHSGEGIISTIKWSLSGKYVLWVNEQGIKIMRSNLHLESNESGLEWKRISHVNRPDKEGWDEMSGVWRARAEWIDRETLELADDTNLVETAGASANGSTTSTQQKNMKQGKIEEAVVGWGNFAWIIKVSPPTTGGGTDGSEKTPTSVVVATIIRFDDCTISGVSLYTPNLLLVLAFMERKESANSQKANDGRKKRHRHNALEPELRLVDINTKEEIDTDTLSISRFETLSSSDYHLGILPPVRIPNSLLQKGYLGTLGSGVSAIGSGIGTVSSGLYTGVETVGQGVWDATMYGPRMLGANRLFSGTDSIRSGGSGLDKPSSVKERNYLTGWIPGFGSSVAQQNEELNDVAQTQGMKIFIFSPYDCIVAVRRNFADRLKWLVTNHKYKEAWELVDEHPESAGAASDTSEDSTPLTPSKASSAARTGSMTAGSPAKAQQQTTLAEFFADSLSITSSSKGKHRGKFSIAEKEKRRIGELWLRQLVDAEHWTEAGEVAGKVLNTTSRWDHWIWAFIKAQRFDEISPYVPTLELIPPLPSPVFEMILGHYVSTNRSRFKELLDQWPSDIFEISSITAAIEDQLKSGMAPTNSKDWRILQECLAKLFLADGRYTDALKCYIQLQDAETAMAMIKEHHLIEAIADDIPSFVQLRVTADQLKAAKREELDELAAEPIRLLVEEATHGVVAPDEVVTQLETASLDIFIFFYLRALWRGEGTDQRPSAPRVGHSAAISSLAADSGRALVEQFADTAVDLFAEYDRELLMEFLQTSTAYTFEKAVKVSEKRHYINELVYLLSKTGQMKKALFLIIDELQDVSKAIEFTKEQNDKGLWDDFLDYSMSKPRFISGLLSEVGTAIDPITLVRRIPSGLEIEGLRDGLKKMIREYDLQDSISSGVAQVLSSEVYIGMERLRQGRRKGIKFDILPAHRPKPKAVQVQQPEAELGGTVGEDLQNEPDEMQIPPGQCASCHKAFHANEIETLVGFACGHVFHVSHLLHGPDSEGGDEPSGLPTNDSDDFETSSFQRTIGPKVTNARLLKDKIEAVGGCTICRSEKKKLEEV